MSNEGEKLFEAVQQVRQLFVEIARMLSDCDGQMQKASWKSMGTASLSGNSASINHPAWWIPHVIHRCYVKDDRPDSLKTIVVLLKDEWEGRVDKLIILAAEYESADGQAVQLRNWDHSWWWLNKTERNCDGTITRISADEMSAEDVERFKQVRIFARLLTDVTDVDTIKSLVVDPLIAM